jgi:hypothetical protein
MADFILGMNAKIYQGVAGAALGALTEITNCKDVTLNLEAGESDITTRANAGWRGTASTLRECTADFEMLWKPGDAGFDAILAAFLATDPDLRILEFAILDQDKATSGAQGPKGSFSVTSFSRNEALEEAIMVSVTIKIATFDEWVTV